MLIRPVYNGCVKKKNQCLKLYLSCKVKIFIKNSSTGAFGSVKSFKYFFDIGGIRWPLFGGVDSGSWYVLYIHGNQANIHEYTMFQPVQPH